MFSRFARPLARVAARRVVNSSSFAQAQTQRSRTMFVAGAAFLSVSAAVAGYTAMNVVNADDGGSFVATLPEKAKEHLEAARKVGWLVAWLVGCLVGSFAPFVRPVVGFLFACTHVAGCVASWIPTRQQPV